MDQIIVDISSRSYGLCSYFSSICEYLWVYTYHKYYDTEKYKQWQFATELLETYRRNKQLAEKLSLRDI